MADDLKMARAKDVYESLCDAIDRRKWHYTKEEDRLLVRFGVIGKDIPMQFVMVVDADRQLVRLFSPMPFKMSENKRIEGAIATAVATYELADGSFDYSLGDGTIAFRMTASFRESTIGEGLFQYMISCSCAVVDEFNDKFLAIEKGVMSIGDFIASRK